MPQTALKVSELVNPAQPVASSLQAMTVLAAHPVWTERRVSWFAALQVDTV